PRDPVATLAAARDLATKIPGARFVEFPGDTHSMIGIAEKVAAEVEEFLTGVKTQAPHDRVLATILFVDIVDSTGRLSKMGDVRWRELLERHNCLVSREFDAFQIKEVRTTGVGCFA